MNMQIVAGCLQDTGFRICGNLNFQQRAQFKGLGLCVTMYWLVNMYSIITRFICKTMSSVSKTLSKKTHCRSHLIPTKLSAKILDDLKK